MLRVQVSRSRPLRTLCFDLETLAAGYADPAWVPDKITVASWSWMDETAVHTVVTGKDGFFSARLRGERLRPFLDVLRTAHTVTGHNVTRFDLPVLQAECARCGLPPLGPTRVHDTIKILRTKGLKKGQDDLSVMLGGTLRKKTLNWSEWDLAYEQDGWPVAIDRCESDVRQQKELYLGMQKRGLLKPARMWRP